jgi:hypothetical protein
MEGPVDAPGRWLVGAKGEYPLRASYRPAAGWRLPRIREIDSTLADSTLADTIVAAIATLPAGEQPALDPSLSV